MSSIELSVILPCLNEAETVGVCVAKAVRHLAAEGVSAEVIVADNGSTDGSQEIARAAGARVVHIPTRGYGAAIQGGIAAARGTYVLMADSDDSYDLGNLMPFVEKLREGYELVMGNRFTGGIEPGAMPFLHRIGNPVLSGIGKLFFNVRTNDFHCGIRAFARHAILELDLHTTGMEFASEVVVQASLAKLRTAEVPTTLSKDGRSRPPHLRTWRDGWRHLRFLLMYSPGWLFLLPALVLLALGLEGVLITATGPHRLGPFGLDTGTLVVSSLMVITGVQLCMFWAAAHSFAQSKGLVPRSMTFEKWMNRFSLERNVIAGLVLFVAGAIGLGIGIARWTSVGFGELDRSAQIRLLVPSATGVVIGLQLVFGSFLVGISTLKLNRAPAAFIEHDEPRAVEDDADVDAA
ncbi:MAG: glycosyltransferase family 2 protein [Actinobacteria bacterium]|nr:glycosyltransferase family 2 protein [Actinomycetota bacterium]